MATDALIIKWFKFEWNFPEIYPRNLINDKSGLFQVKVWHQAIILIIDNSGL